MIGSNLALTPLAKINPPSEAEPSLIDSLMEGSFQDELLEETQKDASQSLEGESKTAENSSDISDSEETLKSAKKKNLNEVQGEWAGQWIASLNPKLGEQPLSQAQSQIQPQTESKPIRSLDSDSLMALSANLKLEDLDSTLPSIEMKKGRSGENLKAETEISSLQGKEPALSSSFTGPRAVSLESIVAEPLRAGLNIQSMEARSSMGSGMKKPVPGSKPDLRISSLTGDEFLKAREDSRLPTQESTSLLAQAPIFRREQTGSDSFESEFRRPALSNDPSELSQNSARPSLVSSNSFQTQLHPLQGELNPKGATLRTSEQVLSEESVRNVSLAVQKAAKDGDGEMKVRLKPDHLGDLLVKVKAEGNQISLEIQAKEEKTKSLIEASLGQLKKDLSEVNLILGSVGLSVDSQTPFEIQPQMTANTGMFDDQRGQHSQQNHQEGRQWASSDSRSDRFYERQRENVEVLRPVRNQGRLDIRA